MKKMKKQRKGFTLTELAIVIAVIAILIAVLVPTFTSLISKANESADEQAVKSMNTALSADEAINGKKTNPSEAMEVLKDAGYNVENYQALDSNNVIYWNSETNRTLLYSTSENAVIYPSDAVSTYASTDFSDDYIPNYWYTLSTAYKTTKYEGTTTSSFETALKNLSDGETLQLTSDITLDYSSRYKSGDSYIFSSLTLLDGSTKEVDLNGYTITDKGYLYIMGTSSTLVLRNGTYKADETVTSNNCNIFVSASCSITLDGVNVTAGGAVIYPQGNSAQVNIINSTITTTGAYGVATNAAKEEYYGVVINISNSTISTAGSSDFACGVLVNGDSTLNITDSTIIGCAQGVFVRAGEVSITNSVIKNSISAKTLSDELTAYTTGSNWSSGTGAAMGALVVGNKNGTYYAGAVVTLTDCTLSSEVTDDENGDYSAYEIALYAIKGTSYATTVSIDNCNFSGNYVINYNSSADLGSYTGTVYSTWNDGWTTTD